ncbi:hypothetical protein SAMN05421870_106219 [Streptomyces qinglanensis]|uniref:Uncharacterized protein n=1 Tax=Streptomyces qinglanensis TaxID=943816 RepID=A0A1H9TKK6_9ACTN|nr:hypothetical protein SAMN05421870_106219 [Streptomyces qinglanensis]
MIKDSAASQEAVAVPGVSGFPGPDVPRGSNPPSSPVKIPRCDASPTAMRDYGMCSNSSLRTRSRSALCGKTTLSRLVIKGCAVEWQGVRPRGSAARTGGDERRRIRLRGAAPRGTDASVRGAVTARADAATPAADGEKSSPASRRGGSGGVPRRRGCRPRVRSDRWRSWPGRRRAADRDGRVRRSAREEARRLLSAGQAESCGARHPARPGAGPGAGRGRGTGPGGSRPVLCAMRGGRRAVGRGCPGAVPVRGGGRVTRPGGRPDPAGGEGCRCAGCGEPGAAGPGQRTVRSSAPRPRESGRAQPAGRRCRVSTRSAASPGTPRCCSGVRPSRTGGP